MDSKFILQSRTIWGVIIMALPAVLPLFGIEFGAEAVGESNIAFNSLIEFVGAVLAVYGRFKAETSISVTPVA